MMGTPEGGIPFPVFHFPLPPILHLSARLLGGLLFKLLPALVGAPHPFRSQFDEDGVPPERRVPP
jgi:hypothetical protein